ncbi:MAG: Ig-like domain-containing protein [Myxococcota bacterium]
MFIVASLVGCGQTPAEVKFAGDETVTVFATEAVPVTKATVLDAEGKELATQPELKWTVSPDSVAKLEGDKVVPVASGDAKVKACATEQVCKEYNFVVALPEKVVISGAEGVEWKVGATAPLMAKVMAAGDKEVPNQTVTFASDNAAIATVDDKGTVTAVAPGAATITATSGTMSATQAITVVDAAAAATN